MSILASRSWISALCLMTVAGSLVPAKPMQGQSDSAAAKLARAQLKAVKHAREAEPFYLSAAPLELKLTTNIGRIRSDKSDSAPWRSATISFVDTSGKQVSIATEIKTRGIWRLPGRPL